MPKKSLLITVSSIENKIYFIRGQKVMIDSDLAILYGVSTKRLNEQVKRNLDRFPMDFMFQLTVDEVQILRSQFATSSSDWGGRRFLPRAFTEHGTVMLASVLNSPKAIDASIFVVRAFVRLREILSAHKDLSRKLTELEAKFSKHDREILALFEAIRQLMRTPEKSKRQIGFRKGD